MSKGSTIHLYINDELKEQLKRKAQKKGLTLTGYLRMILIEDLQKE